MQEDKRQVTGNLVINAVGQVIFTVLVFTGKTPRSLPSIETRDKYPQLVYEYSPNHWSNHEIQVRLLKRVYRWVLEDTATDMKISLEEAEKHVKCIHFLDCWPTNLTEKLRQEIRRDCPGMQLLFLAAGSTGSKQVLSFVFYVFVPSFILPCAG